MTARLPADAFRAVPYVAGAVRGGACGGAPLVVERVLDGEDEGSVCEGMVEELIESLLGRCPNSCSM